MVGKSEVATTCLGGRTLERMTASVNSLKSRIGSTAFKHEVAILAPCFNEELTVGKTVTAFRNALPMATVYVYDNNSTDRTVQVARAAGAVVRNEPRQGKGNVVRRMFADIDADVYVLADGDATYEAEAAPRMVRRAIEENLDFVNGARVSRSIDAYRRGHRFGNYVLTALVRDIFGRQFTDMLSGYKVFSRRYVKSFPATSRGFEIETELTVHALELRMPCAEEFTLYGERPSGSASKLSTFRDGARILRLIFDLVRHERPLQFFGLVGALLILTAVALAAPLARTYLETGLVPRLPTAVLAVGLIIVGFLSWLAGLILDVVATMRNEMKRLAYLSYPPVSTTSPRRSRKAAFDAGDGEGVLAGDIIEPIEAPRGAGVSGFHCDVQ
jgi:Glycosyl transferase family 2